VRASVPFAKIPEAQRSARARLGAVLPTLEARPLGRSCTRWTPPAGGMLPMEMGTIVARAFQAKGDVVPSDLPSGRAIHFLMKGPFDGLPGAWETVFAWCTAEKLVPAGINWEIYGATADAELYALLA
jgi:hypothetical protein